MKIDKVKSNLTYIHKVEVYKFNGKYYTQRAWFFNELSNYYNINLYCVLYTVDKLNLDSVEELSDNIVFYNFFEYGTTNIDFIKNFNKYKSKLSNIDKKNNIYFIHYPDGPGKIIGLLLKNAKLVIWVKSDPLNKFLRLGSFYKRIIKLFLFPFYFIYNKLISRIIFKGNLIFYTSDIIFNKKNHINQIEFISCSNFNKNVSLIKSEINKKIVFVGSEKEQKGLNILLKALNNINNNVELNIIGLDSISKKENLRLA
ncbi:hypothetical protein [Candidatus Absconditicoccus praedator]|uniref:hypothetical protein n=1 Tax=Candidatus Absconditicoccus praedator TaxID=2735562 RepID=UPI001E5E459B|nr:hypothetical protein [Candidatus Absconditicoccus praedator]UFX82753.1 hypothetical protein HLG78_01205 [Candidatus Absconditicoccus praedator]